MKHLVICDYGSSVGLDKHKIAIKQRDKKQVVSYPLNRLSTLSIAKNGVSISSDLIESLSSREIILILFEFLGIFSSINS